MQALWRNMVEHRVAAASFVLCWLSVLVWALLTSPSSMPDYAVSLQVIAAAAAGAFVGWWQFPQRDGLLAGRRLAQGPLAGALVAVVVVTLVFLREAVLVVFADTWQLSRIPEFLISWLVASLLLGAIGSFLGMLGALSSGILAALVKK